MPNNIVQHKKIERHSGGNAVCKYFDFFFFLQTMNFGVLFIDYAYYNAARTKEGCILFLSDTKAMNLLPPLLQILHWHMILHIHTRLILPTLQHHHLPSSHASFGTNEPG